MDIIKKFTPAENISFQSFLFGSLKPFMEFLWSSMHPGGEGVVLSKAVKVSVKYKSLNSLFSVYFSEWKN